MKIRTYTPANGNEYCILGFHSEDECSRLVDTLIDGECFLNSLSDRMALDNLLFRFEHRVSASSAMPGTTSCIVLRGDEVNLLTHSLLTMLGNAVMLQTARNEAEKEMQDLCNDYYELVQS